MPEKRMAQLVCFFLLLMALPADAAPMLRGVNLAGAEFAPAKLPGAINTDYTYPSPAIITAYAQFGMNVIRLPFLWERIQPRLGGPLAPEGLRHLDETVNLAARQHMSVVLDLHNYGSYRGTYIGEKAVPVAAFAQVWQLLAMHYRNQPNVIFGVMNEPNKQNAEDWAKAAKAALLAIRSTGAKQLVLIPGTRYTGAYSWDTKTGKLSNAEALAHLHDPAGNLAIEFHHYFDDNYSGTHNACVAPQVTIAALTKVSAWLKKTHHKGFLGEFGASKEPACQTDLQTALGFIDQHAALWTGWTYWGASEWFGDYPFNIYPVNLQKFPQLAVLKAYLK